MSTFNKDIYNLREPVIPKEFAKESSRICRIPKKRLSSIYIVNEPYEIAICLPPKCGTTNWRKVKAIIQLRLEEISMISAFRVRLGQQARCSRRGLCDIDRVAFRVTELKK